VICKEEDTDGRASVTTDEERVLHCVQKKTPTHIFFHISMSDV